SPSSWRRWLSIWISVVMTRGLLQGLRLELGLGLDLRDGGRRQLVDQHRAVGERGAAGRGLERPDAPGIARHRQVVASRVVLVDAAGAARGPLGLDGPRLGVGMDADVVVQVDRGAVDGVGHAGAAVVAAQHADARLELAGESLVGLVAELDALRDRLAAAREGELGRA